ncbi:MAG TPA: hypothetical protein VFW35_12940 [Sphingomicrobium sp.]|nr:hypothetical protein [Sphingomicrobium sp.]
MKKLILCVTLIVAACHDRRPPAPTAEQSAELNDADRMLDNLANEEGPKANASGPSNSSD